MPIVNYAEYLTHVNNPHPRTILNKLSITVVAGRINSLWTTAPLAGVAPTVPVVPTNFTPGALPFVNSADVQRIAQIEASGVSRNMVIICDRLSHQAGLNATVTGAQTTNLPTAALTRYTDGLGVMAALEIYTAVGTTVTTANISYTNELGVAGRASQLTAFGGTGFREAVIFIPMSVADGDRGVRSVENVTVTATTGTAGNFGVTLFRPLFAFPVLVSGQQMLFDSVLGMCGNMPQALNNACLFALIIPSAGTSGDISATINIIRE